MAFGILYGLRVCGIYKIINTANNKIYVGSSVQVESRILKHLSFLRRGRHPNGHLQSAFTNYGEDAFDFLLIERCDKESLLAREQYYIDTLNPEYNICTIAGNTLGYKHGQEAKAKMTAANMGNKRWVGRKHTEETKKRLSAVASARPVDYERLKRMAEGNKGNTHTLGHTLSAEHRAKVSVGLLDAWSTEKRSKEAAAERLRLRWSDPVWKEQQSEKIRKGKAARRQASELE